jgi:hypothetical protein
MRYTADNNNFYRTNDVATAPKDKYKLNMTGANGVFSQILVAYLPETTTGYDRMYDAGRNSVSTAQLFSVLESDGRKLAINARPTFANTDVVPLGISKTDATEQAFTISIADKEGVFNNEGTNVYIHDLVNNTYHNLNTGDFNFNTNQTDVLGRFEIVYQTAALANPTFQELGVAANISNNTLQLQAVQNMVGLEVFDITGKKLFESKIGNATNFSAAFNYPQAVYVVKVKLDNGKVAAIKLLNEK